ncbi:MAG: hypothetical protein HY912_04770 [Desulfomonile tiedjei]|uniref:Uncharacterized protein n=1 Tax=Desulfomonile tiedjei TaxID=2358 RepID=A0A9D6Z2Q2_9BACT|nr:hypothetical protein [Desulfomonile tiedjei]
MSGSDADPATALWRQCTVRAIPAKNVYFERRESPVILNRHPSDTMRCLFG